MNRKLKIVLLFVSILFVYCAQDVRAQGPCDTCLSTFRPDTTKTYIISAWVSNKKWIEDWNARFTLHKPTIVVKITNQYSSLISSFELNGRGDIIDGWQRIDTTFTFPVGSAYLALEFSKQHDQVGDDTAYFDDVRILPLGSTMKSFVYDQRTMQFVAELDVNNYATLYEYDEEGVLVRVKRETIRGIETVKETRNNTVKKTQ